MFISPTTFRDDTLNIVDMLVNILEGFIIALCYYAHTLYILQIYNVEKAFGVSNEIMNNERKRHFVSLLFIEPTSNKIN